MKKILAVALSLTVAVLTILFTSLAPESKSLEQVKTLSQTEGEVTPLSSNIEDKKILSARFLNMLSRNYVYGEDIAFVENIVNSSMPALLSLRETDSDFIKQVYVSSFIYNMYGVDNINYSEINREFPSCDGMVYIIPKGYSLYEHEMVSLKENEDGSYTVSTKVTVKPHDDESYIADCTTLFVKNNQSQFGFNIISSKLS